MVELNCPKCGLLIDAKSSERANNYEEKLGYTICSSCGHEFIAEAIGLPSGYIAEITGQDLLIRKKWYEPLKFVISAVMGGGFLLVILVMILIQLFSNQDDGSKVMNYVHIAFLAIPSLLFIRVALAIRFNITDITVNSTFLEIRTYPLPNYGRKKIPSNSIRQIYCRETVSRSGGGRYSRHSRIVYQMEAVLNSGKVVVLDRFGNSTEPKQLERLIEKYLGIQDQRVSVEYTES